MRFRTESHGIYLDTDGNAPYSLRCPLIYLVEQAMIQLVDGKDSFLTRKHYLHLSFLYLCGVGEFTLFIGYVKKGVNTWILITFSIIQPWPLDTREFPLNQSNHFYFLYTSPWLENHLWGNRSRINISVMIRIFLPICVLGPCANELSCKSSHF